MLAVSRVSFLTIIELPDNSSKSGGFERGGTAL